MTVSAIPGEFAPTDRHVRVKGSERFAILEPGDQVEVIYRPNGWVQGLYPARVRGYSPTGRVQVESKFLGRKSFAPRCVFKVEAP